MQRRHTDRSGAPPLFQASLDAGKAARALDRLPTAHRPIRACPVVVMPVAVSGTGRVPPPAMLARGLLRYVRRRSRTAPSYRRSLPPAWNTSAKAPFAGRAFFKRKDGAAV